MITLEQVKDSSVLRYLAREARKEGRAEGAAKMLMIAVQQRFPAIEASKQIKQIRDAKILETLFVELNGIKSARVFLQRLNELAAQTKMTSRKAKKNGTSKK